MKSVKSSLTLKATRSSLLPVTRLAAYGALRQETRSNAWAPTLVKATRTKFSLAHSTTRAIPSSQAPKIIPAVSGKTSDS